MNRLARILVLVPLVLSAAVAAAQDPGVDAIITGSVTGVDDALLPNVVVSASATDSAASGLDYFTVPVDPDGSYRLDVRAGTYWVTAWAPELETQFYDGASTLSDATPVTVGAGDVVDGIDFTLRRAGAGTGALSGSVVASDGSGPVAGADVLVTSPLHWNVAFRTATATDGSYRVDGLAGGSYFVRVSGPGYVAEYFDDARSMATAARVAVDEPAETSGIDFALDRAGAVGGRVLGADGRGLDGAVVTAWSRAPSDSTGGVPGDSTGIGPDGTWTGGRETVRTSTGPDGRYRLDGLAPGTWFLAAESRSGRRHAVVWFDGVTDPNQAAPVDVVAGGTIEGIDFNLPFAGGEGLLVGFVRDTDGQPIDGALVSAYEAADPDSGCCGPWAVGASGPDGRYELHGLPPGDYVVSASARGGWSWVERWYPDSAGRADAEAVVVRRDEITEGIDFALPLTGFGASVAGTVRDEVGNPLIDALVLVESLDDPDRPTDEVPVQAWSRSDSAGTYAVSGLPAGAYVLSASWWDGDRYAHGWYDGADTRDQATPIVLADEETRENVDVVLDPRYLYGSLGGRVVDDTGAPVSRALVAVQLSSATSDLAPFRHHEPHAVSDADGRFVIERLPVGSYLLVAYADGAYAWFDGVPVRDQATPVEVSGGATADVTIVVERWNDGAGAIEGRVAVDTQVDLVDSTGTGVVPPIAVVVARPTVTILSWPESERFHTAVTRPDGTYRMEGLPEGEYRVRAFAPGFVEEFFDDVFLAEEATPVSVEAAFATTGIDFNLVPMYWFGPVDDAARAGRGINGFVRNAAGDPVADAVVYLMGADGAPVASTRTASDGSYAFDAVDPGHYRLMVSKEGYEAAFNGGAESLEDAGLIPVGAGVEGVDLTLASGSATGTDGEPTVPDGFRLEGNYPNPFNPTTTIRFDLPEAAEVSIQIYDVLGRRVLTPSASVLPAGAGHSVRVDASALTSGLYLYRVVAVGATNTWSATGRMTLVR